MVQLEYDPQGFPEITVEVLGVVSSKVQGDLERFKVLIEKAMAPGWSRNNPRYRCRQDILISIRSGEALTRHGFSLSPRDG
jgi:hypothetical protein